MLKNIYLTHFVNIEKQVILFFKLTEFIESTGNLILVYILVSSGQ